MFTLPLESYPYTLGTDGAGVIEEVGPGVTNLKKGDKVVVHGDLFDRETCTDQQYAKAEAVFVAKVPDNITLDQACTLPVAIIAIVVGYYHKTGLGLTPPWTADGLGKYKGESIFIPGGASSVGQFGMLLIASSEFINLTDEYTCFSAIQLARLSGFSIIATTASEHNHDLVKSLGATHVFPRTTSAADIKAAIGPVKLSLDSISKADTQALSLAVLEKAEGSHLILCGWPTEDTKTKAAPINARIILGSSMRTRDVSVPFWAVVEDWLRDGVCTLILVGRVGDFLTSYE